MAKKNKNKKVSEITTWTAKKKLFEKDGDLFIARFERVFDKEGIEQYDQFKINKKSYANIMDTITDYLNYFVDKFDDDNELISAYYALKNIIDKQKDFNGDNMKAFIVLMYEILFTPEICKKIADLVTENYHDDIDNNVKTPNKEYLESLEFNNLHVMIMLRISFGMKMIIPVMCHFFSVNKIKSGNDNNFIYLFFRPLFDIWNDEANLYNKVYVYIKSRVVESYAMNKIIFGQREIFGKDLYLIASDFTRRVLISDNMPKYTFLEKGNVVGFNKTVIKYQIQYFLAEAYKKNLTEVNNTKNAEGLSGADKMEIFIKKINEGDVVFAEMNADESFQRIRRDIDIPVYQYEIDYLKKYQKPSEFQIRLIYNYFSKYLGNYRDSYAVCRNNYYHLSLLIKKKLLLESGWVGNDGVYHAAALPFILTGNMGKMNTRLVRNNRFLSKIKETSAYINLLNNQYKYLLEIEPDYFETIISTLINTPFTFVTPEDPEFTGEKIVYDEDKISDEIIMFFTEI